MLILDPTVDLNSPTLRVYRERIEGHGSTSMAVLPDLRRKANEDPEWWEDLDPSLTHERIVAVLDDLLPRCPAWVHQHIRASQGTERRYVLTALGADLVKTYFINGPQGEAGWRTRTIT